MAGKIVAMSQFVQQEQKHIPNISGCAGEWWWVRLGNLLGTNSTKCLKDGKLEEQIVFRKTHCIIRGKFKGLIIKKLLSLHLSTPASDSLEHNERKGRKCVQTKTPDRENVSGVFQMVASTQTAEQWPRDLPFCEMFLGQPEGNSWGNKKPSCPSGELCLLMPSLWRKEWKCVVTGEWGRM